MYAVEYNRIEAHKHWEDSCIRSVASIVQIVKYE